MQRLKSALEQLDEEISLLEDKIGVSREAQQDARRRYDDMLKQSKGREAAVLAVAQKVASRLDRTIAQVEQVLRD
jgi:hypothetical protein